MGIQGLLPGLKPFTESTNVRQFSGQAVAVDASSWLHKSVYSIAPHYVEALEAHASHVHDNKCLQVATRYMVQRTTELLQYAHLRAVYLVSDGVRCPLKAPTNDERHRKRQQALQQARAPHNNNKFEKYKTCIQMTNDFCHAVLTRVMQHFAASSSSKQNVHWITSPYEADAQLVELCRQGTVQAVITEDSDVLVYSAACNHAFPILFKLDRNSGNCQVLNMSWLLDAERRTRLLQHYNTTNSTTTALDLIWRRWMQHEQRQPGLARRLFVQACVLAGCDYAPRQLKGVGLVRAFQLVDRQAATAADQRFVAILKQQKQSSKSQVMDWNAYEVLLAQSEAVFYHHVVLQANQKVGYLNELQGTDMPQLTRFDDALDFLGTTGSKEPPPTTSNKEAPPLTEIVVMHRKRKADSTDEPQPRKKVVHNPYAKSSAAAVTEKENDHPNPFAQFRFSKPTTTPNESPPPAITTAAKKSTLYSRSSVRHLQDVRFVKTQFAKDGHTILPPSCRRPPTTIRSNVAALVDPTPLHREVEPQEDRVGEVPRDAFASECNDHLDNCSPPEDSTFRLDVDPPEPNQTFRLDVDPPVPNQLETPTEEVYDIAQSWSSEDSTFRCPDVDPLGTTTERNEIAQSWSPNEEIACARSVEVEADRETFSSKYFSSRSPANLSRMPLPRRVTLEDSPEQNTDSEWSTHGEEPRRQEAAPKPIFDMYDDFMSPKKSDVAPKPVFNVERPDVPSAFDMYDDFMSPKKPATLDDIQEDTPDESFKIAPLSTFASSSSARASKITLGPAKTLRYRFGLGGTKQSNPATKTRPRKQSHLDFFAPKNKNKKKPILLFSLGGV